MEWLDALILGIVQGLTEYLPVSSSGHLQIFREILGVELPNDQSLAFDIILHAATVCSTLVILWPLFRRLIVSFFTFKRDADFYYVCKLLLSAVPVAIVGFCFKDYVEDTFNNLTVVGICLLVTAGLLFFAHVSDLRAVRRLQMNAGRNGSGVVPASAGRDITWLDAFIIGCGQAVAVLPGLSRSGTTIATGILLGDKRDQMAQFSFLMVIIPILGESLLNIKDMLMPDPGAAPDMQVGIVAMSVGFVAAFTVGCCACRWMIDLVKKGKLVWFSLYCVVMGLICLLWQ